MTRGHVTKKYNVQDPGQFLACCYPCSYFQMLVSVMEWDKEDKGLANQGGGVVEQQSVVGTAVASPVYESYQPPKPTD